MSLTDGLIKKYPIISDQMTLKRLEVILKSGEESLSRTESGAIVEFGCYVGTTTLFLRRLLNKLDINKNRELHVYDSFEGLPDKNIQDKSIAGDQFSEGELKTSKKQLITEFYRANLKPPIIHKAWFSELEAKDVPEKICFAFLDGDFYQSILSSLSLVWNQLVPGAQIVIDDFGRESLPGVDRAVKFFLSSHSYKKLKVVRNIAIIEK